MKKILLFSLLIILIPTLIVNIFIKDEEIKFIYHENMYIRVKRKNGEIDKVPLEEYIVGVLAGEMPLSFSDDAFKAQAIAARTYALKRMENNVNNEFDVVDTVQNQVYLDFDYLESVWKEKYTDNINRLKKIVLATEGCYLTYEGKTIEAFYFSTSSGMTENSYDVFGTSLPYLQNVSSSWDNISPVYREVKKYKLLDFYNILKLEYNEDLNIEIIEKTIAGRIKKIKINNKIYTGSEIVNLFELRSANFVIESSNNYINITTKGYGHGVGMSQYGAHAMSIQGYNYEEILKYYYKGVEIKKIWYKIY